MRLSHSEYIMVKRINRALAYLPFIFVVGSPARSKAERLCKIGLLYHDSRYPGAYRPTSLGKVFLAENAEPEVI